MGNLAGMQSSSQESSREGKVDLQSYSIVGADDHGNNIMELQDRSLALAICLSLDDASYSMQKEQLALMLNAKFTNLCNTVAYEVKKQSYLCNKTVQVTVLMEHFSLTLDRSLESSPSFLESNSSGQVFPIHSQVEVMDLLKFLLETASESKEKLNKWITFHPKFIRYDPKKQCFRYLALPSTQSTYENECFFDYERDDSSTFSPEKQTVFSIGMVLLSVLLKEDCSDCYNFQYLTFCQSMFEEKLDKLDEKYAGQSVQQLINSSNVTSGTQIQQEVYEILMSSLQGRAQRPSLHELKRQFYGVLRRVSMHHSSAMQAFSKLQSVTTVRKPNQDRLHEQHPYLHNFSTNDLFASSNETASGRQFEPLSEVKLSNAVDVRRGQAGKRVKKEKGRISVFQKRRVHRGKENTFQTIEPKPR